MIAANTSSPPDRPAGRAAGIVAFMPDPVALVRLIDDIAPAVGGVFVFLNSAIDATLLDTLKGHPAVSLIDAEQNLGVGVGLNMIVLAAMLRNFESVILFDQDSKPDHRMIAELGAVSSRLTIDGHRPAVVAPQMVAASRSFDSKAPTYRPQPNVPPQRAARAVQFVPTSGSLISLDAFRRIGLFRADYFIDGIDVEWSFRAWAKDHSCWIVPDCFMQHSIGSGTIALPFIGRRMPNQKPFRMYCAIRNTVYGLRLPHIPIRWKLAQLAYLPFQVMAYARHHRFRAAVVRQLAAGVIDGVTGRLGVPRTAPDGKALRGDHRSTSTHEQREP